MQYMRRKVSRMIHKGKKVIAWLLLAVMLLSMPGGEVYAEDIPQISEEQSDIKVEETQNNEVTDQDNASENNSSNADENVVSAEEPEEVEENISNQDQTQTTDQPVSTSSEETTVDFTQQGLINYVGIDFPYLETPAEQNIVISYGDGTENVSEAKVIVNKNDGSVLEISLSKKEGELFMFTYSFDETATGVYELTDFVYVQDGIEQTIHLADTGIKAMFGVNEEYPGYNEPAEVVTEGVSEQEVEMSVVDVKSGNIEETAADIEDAIQATEEKVGQAQKSRASRTVATQKDGNLVVVLDPGHGGKDSGAVGVNGVYEKNLTLKIAQYCKAELEQYNGITVYMTRTDDTYPGGTGDAAADLDNRVAYAKNNGADVLVSIHLNSTGTGAANGAEVYFPNSSYRPEIGNEGMNLAQKVHDELVSLGIHGRGIKIRNTENGSIYPDGSPSDYYGLIYRAKKAELPAIIIEHAFIDNPSDYNNFLSSDEKLQKLGIADATGIAKTYGLSKVKIEGTGHVDISADEKQGNVVAEIVKGEEAVVGVQAAVWGETNGQNDLRWYDLKKKSNGQWETVFDISNHKECGRYYIDLYAVRQNGNVDYLDSQTFEISTISAEITIGEYDKESGTFELTARNIQSPSGVKQVQFPVWKDGEQDASIYWYTAERQADGSYKAIANVKNHGYRIGTYISHVYITGENGVTIGQIAGNCEVTPADLEVELKDISIGGSEKEYQIRGQNIGIYGGLGMQVAVWGATNGQNDLKWYNGYIGADGQWYADIDISNHGEHGKYYADVYTTMPNGIMMCIKSFQFEISTISAEITIGEYDKESGTFELTARNIQSPSGVKQVQFPVWKDGEQDASIYWYTAERQADGSYKAIANVKNHGYRIGTYISHVYITGENGVTIGQIAGNIVINEIKNDSLYAIMGKTSVSVDQMVRYYNSIGVTYPAVDLGKGGAETIEEFCKIVYEEAESEGVKAEVVFSQIMLETGNLQFGGDVKIEQFNFGGLGATGNGVPGCVFPDVRTGIRANVQHLKCYASDAPLNNDRVDPRWGEWLRNKAPYVQWLGIPENPYGAGWAAGKDYGKKIINIINKIMLF